MLINTQFQRRLKRHNNNGSLSQRYEKINLQAAREKLISELIQDCMVYALMAVCLKYLRKIEGQQARTLPTLMFALTESVRLIEIHRYPPLQPESSDPG